MRCYINGMTKLQDWRIKLQKGYLNGISVVFEKYSKNVARIVLN